VDALNKVKYDCAANSEIIPTCAEVSKLDKLIDQYALHEANLSDAWDAEQAEYWKAWEEMRKTQPLYKHFAILDFFTGLAFHIPFEPQDENISQYTGVNIGAGFLLKLPREILVLMLTMSMGLLGSLVTMTWSFMRRDTGLTVQRFAVLPIVGMTTALVVLVFINAGQMTLTAGDSGALNPFALSFIGIISGLLSERAYARLSDVGNNFFATADVQLRWANHLKEAMAAGSVTTQEMARHLSLPKEDAERIIAEAVPATFEQQRLIAAYMRRPLRDLFTDAPPDDVDKKQQTVVAPYLIGLDEKEAELSLLQVGLTLGEVTKRTDDHAVSGAILQQSPQGGAMVARPSKVDVIVSTGPAASLREDTATAVDSSA
jgi:hypothetical protein